MKSQIHADLKENTSRAHAQLDNSPMLCQLMSSDLSLKQYCDVLSAMYVWFTEAEKLSSHYFSSFNELQFIQDKANLIKQDLQQLNMCDVETLLTRFDRPCLKEIDNLYKALGLLYVLEGSTLGGSVIAPHVSKHFQRKDLTKFYQCYGNKKRENFMQTLNFIDAQVRCDNKFDVILGAKEAFANLQSWLDKFSLNSDSSWPKMKKA